MTRIVLFMLAFDASAIAGATVYYIVAGKPTAAVLGAIAGVIGAYVAGGCVAIIKRSRHRAKPADTSDLGIPDIPEPREVYDSEEMYDEVADTGVVVGFTAGMQRTNG